MSAPVPRRILLVDDEPLVRTPLQRLLTRAGFTVLEADNGDSAFEVLETEAVHLVLTDLYMPGMTGLELAVGLRAMAPALPIVLMTGEAGEDSTLLRDVDRVYGVHTISKPFAFPALLDLLARVWSRTTARRSRVSQEV